MHSIQALLNNALVQESATERSEAVFYTVSLGAAEQESLARNCRWRRCWKRWRQQKFKWRSQLIKSTAPSWTHMHRNWSRKISVIDAADSADLDWNANGFTIIKRSCIILYNTHIYIYTHIIFRFPWCKDFSSKRLGNWGCTKGLDLCACCWCREPL